jgi:flagellar protein FlaG
VSEISITRFQPARAAKERVHSVESVDTEVDAEKDSGNPSRQPVNTEKRQGQGGRQEQSSSRDEPRHQSQSSSLSTTSQDLERDTEEAVSRLNDYVQNVKRDLVFDFDPDSGEPSVTVLDRESQRVLRQIDSKEALELARRLDEEESLSLFRTQV